MRVLHLTLKKEWFDMIASGEKKEEYREIKQYWTDRLMNAGYSFKHFDAVEFTNGYRKDSPKISVQFMGMTVRVGRKDWGAEEGRKYYVIKLGKIISPTTTPVTPTSNQNINENDPG